MTLLERAELEDHLVDGPEVLLHQHRVQHLGQRLLQGHRVFETGLEQLEDDVGELGEQPRPLFVAQLVLVGPMALLSYLLMARFVFPAKPSTLPAGSDA